MSNIFWSQEMHKFIHSKVLSEMSFYKTKQNQVNLD
jgi:hypothetical protein